MKNSIIDFDVNRRKIHVDFVREIETLEYLATNCIIEIKNNTNSVIR